ncbi:MAG: alcohol dehydrogenase catalytic domain-containing protein [Acidobacteria bacterium]|nr:alcohol dehydrogenase catalytic domain-containing protein [Acidobacteriota bacterium]
MRSAVFYEGREIRVEDVPTPTPAPDEVLVRVGAAGICGSDLHHYRGANPWGQPLRTVDRRGHELAGVVVEVGAEVRGVRPGQRVGVEPTHLLGCGHCRPCRRGAYNICRTRETGGMERRRSAGFSEFDVAPAANLFPLPEDVSLDVGAIVDVYACAVHALNRLPARDVNAVVVIGTGAVGLTLGQVARATGARKVIVVGRREAALRAALEVGAADEVLNCNGAGDTGEAVRELTDGEGADAVFETVGGEGDTAAQAVAAAAFGGGVVVIGCFTRDVTVSYHEAAAKEVELRWSNGYSSWRGRREYQMALDLVAGGRLRASPLISHRFTLEETAEAFAVAADKRASGAIKVVVNPQPAVT